MLLRNGSAYGKLKFLAGGLRANGLNANAIRQSVKENFNAFGQFTSAPQGYQSVAIAKIPSVKTSSLISARIKGDSGLSATQLLNVVSMGATISGDSSLSGDAEVGKTMGATITGNSSLAGDARMISIMSAFIDAGARPSAFDIAQEVWNSQKASYNAAGTLGNALNNASTGGVDVDALAQAVWEYTSRELTGNSTGLTLTQFLALK